jgi:16S rRNA processing protein RimM
MPEPAAVSVGRLGRPHGVEGELYLDDCPLTLEQLLALGVLEWRDARGGRARSLRLRAVRESVKRLLVTFAGIGNREAAAGLVGGQLWIAPARLPDAGPGRSYAYELVGLRVVDPTGKELGEVADVIFNAGQPLLELTGGRLLPCQPPFLKHLDRVAGVITLELPPGFEEL